MKYKIMNPHTEAVTVFFSASDACDGFWLAKMQLYLRQCDINCIPSMYQWPFAVHGIVALGYLEIHRSQLPTIAIILQEHFGINIFDGFPEPYYSTDNTLVGFYNLLKF